MADKLEKLTPEQEALMDEVVKEWLDIFNSCPKLNEEKAKELVEFLYTSSNLVVPPVVFADSPFHAQKLHGLQTYQETASCGGVVNYGRCARNDFFFRIGVLNDQEHGNFKKFFTLLKESAVYDMIQFDELCIVVRYPEYIRFDDRNNVHCSDGSAIKWCDGKELYYLHGVHFSKEAWEKICIERDGAFAIGLENMDERQVALATIGGSTMLDAIGAKKVGEKSPRGNELWVVNKYFTTGIKYCLRYFCPTTGKEYVSFVTPFVEEAKEKGIKDTADIADYAMAKKFGLTLEMYRSGKIVES